jgi:DNA-binding transcriptional LysR family regulator
MRGWPIWRHAGHAGAGAGSHHLASGQSGDGGRGLAGPLRIQAPSSFGSEWLADAVARFAALHPQLTPMLYVDDALLDPIAHGFDLTIRVGGIPDVHALAMRPLAPCRGVLCASPDYLRATGCRAIRRNCSSTAACISAI